MNKMRSFALFFAILFGYVFFPLSAHSEDRDLAQIVRHMETQYHVKQTHIPLWGVIRGIARVARPWKGLGVSLAIFEDQQMQISDFNAFEAQIQSALGEGWQPFVRVQSRRESEQTLIFVKAAKKKFKMMIICLEPSETTVVKTQASWKEFSRWKEDKVDKADRPG